MKSKHVTSLFAVAAAAQNSTNPLSTSKAPRVITTTTTSCFSPGGPTVTGPVTITEPCSECAGGAGGAGATGAPGAPASHSTTWTTEYKMLCSEAGPKGDYLTTATATVTESCTGSKPTFTGPGGVPAGWTSAMVTCTACGPSPISTMATYPMASPMPAGVAGPPPPPPSSPAGGSGAPAAPGSGGGAAPGSPSSPGGSSPGAGSPAAPGAGAGGNVAAPSSALASPAGGAPGGSTPAPAPGMGSPAAPGAGGAPAAGTPAAGGIPTTICAGGTMGGVCHTPIETTVEVSQVSSPKATGCAGGSMSGPCANGTHQWYKGAAAGSGPQGSWSTIALVVVAAFAEWLWSRA